MAESGIVKPIEELKASVDGVVKPVMKDDADLDSECDRVEEMLLSRSYEGRFC